MEVKCKILRDYLHRNVYTNEELLRNFGINMMYYMGYRGEVSSVNTQTATVEIAVESYIPLDLETVHSAISLSIYEVLVGLDATNLNAAMAAELEIAQNDAAARRTMFNVTTSRVSESIHTITVRL